MGNSSLNSAGGEAMTVKDRLLKVSRPEDATRYTSTIWVTQLKLVGPNHDMPALCVPLVRHHSVLIHHAMRIKK